MYGFPVPGPQTPAAQDVMNSVFFLSNEQWESIRSSGNFDYIVIGSGFCGFAFVERILSSNRRARILMIERGPFLLPEHIQNLASPFASVLGGVSETFPWTLSAQTAKQPQGHPHWQSGIFPFVGGRSTVWSAWCPRPTRSEMAHWPEQTICAAESHFESAEKLLGVVRANKIAEKAIAAGSGNRPIYGLMQQQLQDMLANNLHKIDNATRSMAAPLAICAGVDRGIGFAKFSVPSVLLGLAQQQAQHGNPIRIATECVAKQVLQIEGAPREIDTSRGIVRIGNAKVVLAMGTIPTTTFLLNSFPELKKKAGTRFSGHFITSVIARVPRSDFPFGSDIENLELGAIYIAGKNKPNDAQFHIQLSVLSDRNPSTNGGVIARHVPDMLATPSLAQRTSSEDHIVFSCTALGELDFRNRENLLSQNADRDLTTNVTLQFSCNEADKSTWAAMDGAIFQMMERIFSFQGRVEYWCGERDSGGWGQTRPSELQRRLPGLVHDGSTLWIGETDESVVRPDYRPWGVENVFVTGGALWPAGGSWNPTLVMTALAQDLADRLLLGKDQK